MKADLAFVFPGQGSQSLGMLNSFIADNNAIVNAACQEAANVLGYDLAAIIAHDETRLNLTMHTQPALLLAGVIAWRVWQHKGGAQPRMLAGHSLGEFTALVCAESLSFSSALQLVAKRGELMQQAVAPGAGAMAAIIGLELTTIQAVCVATLAGVVQPANINAPGQIVISGTAAAVAEAIARCKTLGAKRAIMLPVSIPSHCELMRPAAEKLAAHLSQITWRAPKIPVVHNYDVSCHTEGAEICLALKKQLYSPVRWIETIQNFMQHGISEIVECGPGKVLTGLNKRIAPELAVLC